MSHGVEVARVTALQKFRLEGTRDPLERCENPGCFSNGGDSDDDDDMDDDCPKSGVRLIGSEDDPDPDSA
jgi:hypothetical protein